MAVIFLSFLSASQNRTNQGNKQTNTVSYMGVSLRIGTFCCALKGEPKGHPPFGLFHSVFIGDGVSSKKNTHHIYIYIYVYMYTDMYVAIGA